MCSFIVQGMKGNILASLFLIVFVSVAGWMIRNGLKPATSPGGGLPVLMDFYADWCGPCKMMKPAVHELANELPGRLQVMEVNVDQNPDLARQYNVNSIPCFVLLRDGKEVNRRTGFMSKESLRQLTGL